MDDSKDAALRMAALAALLDRRTGEALTALVDGRDAIDEAARGLGLRGQQLVTEVGRQVQAETRGAAERALQEALGESLDGLKTRIGEAARQARDAAAVLANERQALSRQQRGAFWVGSVALAVGALLLAGASAAWLAMKRKELSQIEFALELHRATEAGALVPCGGRLCARVGEKPRRAGERGEYLVVE